MLFPTLFKLLSVATILLPALLVGASPHSLTARAGTGEIRHLKLVGYVGSDATNTLQEFKEVTLEAIAGDDDDRFGDYNQPANDVVETFVVRGGWQGTPARAKATRLTGKYEYWINLWSRENFLAFGHDSGASRVGGKLTRYVIYKDGQQHDDSDGSEDTVKG